MAVASFDLETWAIDMAVHPAPPIVCVSFQVEGQAAEIMKGPDAAVIAFCKLLKQGHELVGANLVFDLGCLCAAEPAVLPKVFKALEDGRLHDVALRERLRDIARGCLDYDPITGAFFKYSLADLEMRYFGRDRKAEKENGWRLRYHELDDVPLVQWPIEARDYPLADARGTLEVFKAQEAGDRLNFQCEPQEMRAMWALKVESLRGIRTDPVTVADVVGEIEREHKASREKFFAAGFVSKRKPRGGKDPETPDGVDGVLGDGEEVVVPFKYVTKKAPIQARVLEAYGGNPPLTEKGGISTDRDCLTESGDDLLEAFGEASENEKLRTTYADVLKLGTQYPIHVSFNSLLNSQRTSCREPNLQQLPRAGRIRECFVPRFQHLLCSTDYGTLEMGTLAQVCYLLFGHSVMRDALNANQDLHTRLAARIAGTTYEDAIARLHAGDKTIKNLRQASKPVNFGIPGGMGPAKVVLTGRKQGVRFCELAGVLDKCGTYGKVHSYRGRQIPPTCVSCLEICAQYCNLFKEEWPEVVEYHQVTAAVADSGQPVKSMAEGEMLRWETGFCAVSNHYFQNLAAVLAKEANYRVVRAFTDPNAESLLYRKGSAILFLHDEVLSEVREEVASECAIEQSRILVEVARKHCPDVSIKAPPSICRRWYKAMEPVWENGRLVPWEPKKAA